MNYNIAYLTFDTKLVLFHRRIELFLGHSLLRLYARVNEGAQNAAQRASGAQRATTTALSTAS